MPDTALVCGELAAPRVGTAQEWESRIRVVLIGGMCLWMLLVMVLPLFTLLVKSLQDQQGNFVGLANFITYFQTPALSASLGNSLYVSVMTTLIAVPLGFVFAYALTRSHMPAKGFFKGLALAPLCAPTLLNGLALIYLFGRKGLITKGFFGAIPGWDIGLYGSTGIIISEVIYTFPQAMLILSVALSLADARLYEAAASLSAGRLRTFFTVTLPSVKYGLISAVFVCFVLAFTDFGAPKVVGGRFNILATDIYKQVIGQQNFVMGAVVSVVLLIPSVLAFLVDRMVQRRQVALVAAKSVPLKPRPQAARDTACLVYCSLIGLLVLAFYGTALYASLVKVWPYKLTLGLWHYNFDDTGGGGYHAFFTSLRMALYSALFGTILTFGSAYLIEKTRGLKLLRTLAHLLSLLPLALPGMVIGLAYIFFFNAPGWELGWLHIPNPFNFLYGTMGILVLANIVHFYTVSFLTVTTALKQMDSEFEVVSSSLGVPFYKTFFRVTVPVCLPAILETAMFYFVNSLATVSAVIFLYSADTPLASVAVANMDDAGDLAPACAMSILIVCASILVRFLYGLATAGIKKRATAWTSN